MVISVRVIEEFSMEPHFKVVFKYKKDKVFIKNGSADVFRCMPKSIIKFDKKSEERLEDWAKEKIKLEILNAVFEYLLVYGVIKSKTGSPILRAI